MTDQPYDAFDYKTWSEEQKDFVGRVREGLCDGDLQPLADYLRAGHYVFPNLATTIADAIEGKDMPFRMYMKGTTRSPLNTTQRFEYDSKRLQIGVFAEKQMQHHGAGKTKVAIGEAMDRFDVRKTVVTEALAEVRKILDKAAPEFRDEVWKSLVKYHSGDMSGDIWKSADGFVVVVSDL